MTGLRNRHRAGALWLVLLVSTTLAPVLHGAELEASAWFGTPRERAGRTLTIIGSTDLSAMRDVLRAFGGERVGVAIRYDQASSRSVYDLALADDGDAYDVVISSAMDLQIKLANDGHARRHVSDASRALPGAMRWRDRVFGFTREPAVIVYNRALVPGGELPANRFALLEYLRANKSALSGKVVTYDVERSGLGYLFATQDSLRSDTFWRLMEVFGDLEVRLTCCTADMLGKVASGEAAIAYNVLGSYAGPRVADGADLAMVVPSDYVLVMTRSALIPAASRNPELAGAFVDYLLAESGQAVLAEQFGVLGRMAVEAPLPERTIRLDPALLVHLDAMTRGAFLEEWRSAIATREAAAKP